MICTVSDAAKAEKFALEQRLAGAKLLRLDESKATSPAALDLAQRVKNASEADPMRFDKMLGERKVCELFSCGALHFKSVGQTEPSIATEP